VRPDPHDQPGVVELEHHRIGDRDARYPRVAHGHAGRAVADDLSPDQVGQRAVDRAEQHPQVIATAEHHAARQRREQFGPRRERRRHPVDIVGPCRVAEHRNRIHRSYRHVTSRVDCDLQVT